MGTIRKRFQRGGSIAIENALNSTLYYFHYSTYNSANPDFSPAEVAVYLRREARGR
jgi:hypothetical protein